MIPDFKCKNCHNCCNNIIWFEPENILIRDFLNENYQILSKLNNLKNYNKNKCFFLNNSGCIIYSVRPIVCRFQGNIRELKCDFSRNNISIDVTSLSQIREKFINLLIKTEGLDYFYSSRYLNKEYFYDDESWK